MIFTVYSYLFYRILKFVDRLGAKRIAGKEWNAFFGLSVLVSINLAILYIKTFGITQQSYRDGHKYILITVFGLLFILNYFLFIHQQRYKQIAARFSTESARSRKAGAIAVGLYAISTVVSIFLA